LRKGKPRPETETLDFKGRNLHRENRK
jgi:hypothetical protein